MNKTEQKQPTQPKQSPQPNEVEESSVPRRTSEKSNGNGHGSVAVSSYAELDALLKERCEKDGKVAIFSHRCPDPDAIGSMMGLQWLLLRSYQKEADLFYSGEVAHPQNKTLDNLIEPGLRSIKTYKPEDYCLNILVDTVPDNAGVDDQEIEFDVVIDHHRDVPHDFEGILIHKKVGSCVAIVFDIIKSLMPDEDHWFQINVDYDAKVATALIAGIMTDTNFLLSEDSTEYDRAAFDRLFVYRNPAFLHQIVFFKRPKFWIDKKAQACVDVTIEEGYAIVGLGMIPDKQRDLIADMAEEMVSWISVETAVAFAFVGGNRIEGSVRSLDASLSVANLCQKLGGKEGSGGGKQGKGAYRVTLSPVIDTEEDPDDLVELLSVLTRREVKRIMRVLK